MIKELTAQQIEDAKEIDQARAAVLKKYDFERLLNLVEKEISQIENQYHDDRKARGLRDTYNKLKLLKRSAG